MTKKMSVKELEDVLLDQIEKLNDDSIMDDPEKAKILIDKSKSMTDLTNAYIGVQRMKLDVVKELNKGGNLYENYLGIESDSAHGKV